MSRIWKMRGGTYAETLAKIQVRGHILTKLIEICMETPCWFSPSLRSCPLPISP